MATNIGLLGSTTMNTDGKQIDYTKQINTLYQNTFGRDAEQAGVNYYQGQLANGRSLSDIQKEIAGSDEAAIMRSTAPPPIDRPTAAQATATGYTPTDVTVGQQSTVQNQLANITGTGSALNTQAATAANKAMASRGLLNSSMAVGAAQDAVLRQALPIASQDATTYANADTTNATQRTAASAFKANADNTVSQFNAAQTNAMKQALLQGDIQKQLASIQANTTLTATDKQAASQQLIANNDNKNKLQLQQIDSDTKKALATMDDVSKTKLAQIDADNKQLLQTNISAANSYAQLAQALSTISNSTTMDAAAKQQASDNQIALFRQNLQAIGQVSKLDLSQYFQQVAAPVSSAPATPDLSGINPALQYAGAHL